MLTNRTEYTWSIVLRDANGQVVSSNTIAPWSDMESFVVSVPTTSGLRRFTDVTVTDAGVYFSGVQTGRRLGGITTVKFLDSTTRAEFKVVG